ncbi:XRE family transcriptional regulator [Paraburkholderia sp. CNPSo 3272]|uniref:XRE family transcriptional regulator n=1 Tax=Paraburkholderia sp. CNPSo 3272 TaxID=2940931 RepID=UPI0020B6BF20|nr:XRE family transcriptional regulator [Paraburkholderia sp. CNPSo 3272]MCP3728308.1 XRE family transcriptional regulator [Paraburkholderia sp. CNPSo 3272]
MSYQIEIRAACLRSAEDGWEQPTGAEIQEVIRRTGLPGRAVARYLGLSEYGGRQVRRWISEDAAIPYSAWALLCDRAGLGCIWRPAADRAGPDPLP